MAALPFVDTHVHFFDLREPRLRYTWLEPDFTHPVLGDIGAMQSQRYWPEDFLAETRFQNVAKTLHVQAALGIADPVEETRWLAEGRDRTGEPHGWVVEVHLAEPAAAEQLERHLAFGGVCGVRDMRPDRYWEDRDWRRGFASLEPHGLVACIDTDPTRFAGLVTLARDFPGITICPDHAGWPRRRDDEYFTMWRRGLEALAAHDNVVMKVSGLGMNDPRWTVDSWRPWVLTCIELFGVDRVVLGTNWPVDRLFSSYGDVIDAYEAILAELAPHERAALFSRNAERIFGV